MDDFDVAADSLERVGYQVGVSFRDSLRVVQESDSLNLRPRDTGADAGYYFLMLGRPPHFVPAGARRGQVLHAVRAWERARQGSSQTPVAVGAPASSVAVPERPPVARLHPTVLLPLDSFHSLPPGARTVFERRGCRVPQSPYAGTSPSNVVQGHFGRKDQTDWAALCAAGETMIVVIAWGGPAACPDTLQRTAQPVSEEHGIAAVDSAYIEQHEQWYGGERSFPVDHEGIDFGIEDKASTVWYCHDGEWWQLPGAD